MTRILRGGRTSPILAPIALAFVLGFLPSEAWALSGADLKLYRQAFALADKDRHDEAVAMAEHAEDPLPAKVLLWMKLQAPMGGSFSEIADFVKENPEWPAPNALRKAAEKVIAEHLDETRMVAWFDANPPVSIDGTLFYADALMRTGKGDRAVKLLRDAWAAQPLSPAEELNFLSHYAEQLRAKDHQARLDRLLWDRDAEGAKRMRPLVGDDYATLIDARLALSDGSPSAAAVADRVPGSLRDEPGFLYDLARYKRRFADDAGAAEILAKVPFIREREDKWWVERNLVARRMIDRGDYATAYRIVAQHRPTEGPGNVDADFLAGWIALRFLNRPNDALRHFQDLGQGSVSPITRSRSAYWCGRAAEAAGDRNDAAKWYRTAAAFGTTFYGQLAASHVDGSGAARMPSSPSPTSGQVQVFERRELVRVARDLAQIVGRDDSRLGTFLRSVGLSAKTGPDYELAARLAKDLGRSDVAITVAKQAVRDDVYLMDVGYPVIRLDTGNPEPALIHGVIRQESTFNTNIVSSAGARGLMQLMPATARLVAKQLNIRHVDAKLTADPAYNVRLGAAYLNDLIGRFGGSYVLAVASYNAGPQRVSEWMNAYGDPRSPGVDAVDWIELIPFSETRNYVQRVLEATLVYRVRFDGSQAALNLEQELRR